MSYYRSPSRKIGTTEISPGQQGLPHKIPHYVYAHLTLWVLHGALVHMGSAVCSAGCGLITVPDSYHSQADFIFFFKVYFNDWIYELWERGCVLPLIVSQFHGGVEWPKGALALTRVLLQGLRQALWSLPRHCFLVAVGLQPNLELLIKLKVLHLADLVNCRICFCFYCRGVFD